MTAHIDGFIARLRAALRGLPESEIEDILREIRSHITELSEAEGSDVAEAIRSLGDPVDLAMTYRAENAMLQAECSGSPLVILQGLRHASRTRVGRSTATLLYVIGYATVISVWREAVHELFVSAGVGAAPSASREIRGWWLVPVLVIAGLAIKYAVDRIAKWWLRRVRRSMPSSAP
ncbi:MAG TPA: DUF1700 domain-containing protein [Candidatus Polarisedimenticolaceae bacterium]|nr:DUF1700 domain-containing protein [Candidatus Polarisedimenticolaceae bacterium]